MLLNLSDCLFQLLGILLFTKRKCLSFIVKGKISSQAMTIKSSQKAEKNMYLILFNYMGLNLIFMIQ